MTTAGGGALGIDFGTSNTVAVVSRPGRPPAPLLFDGSPLLPSAVYAAEDRLLAGRVALRSAAIDPARCEPHPKRCIDDGTVLLGEREYPVAELFTAVFARVADEARRVLDGVPERVVVTHPAGWSTRRLRTLRMAVEAADLPTPDLVPEPVAGAAYFLDHHEGRLPEGRHVLIYDLGGGTCDLTVVRRDGDRIRVVATDGRADAGGTYVDAAIVDHLVRTHSGRDGASERLRAPRDKTDRRHRRMLWDDVREAKENLSTTSTVELVLPLLDADVHLTRDEVASLAYAPVRATVDLAANLIATHGNDTAGIFLVGGASRMPLVATELLRATGIAPIVVEQPELVVAGGALRAADLVAPAEAPRPVPSTPPPVPQAPEPPSEPPYPPDVAGVNVVVIRPDGRVWAYVTNRAIRLWDPVAGDQAPRGALYDGRCERIDAGMISWSPSGRVLAVAYPDRGIELLNPDVIGVRSLHGHRAPVSALAWSPDVRFLASGTVNGELFIRRTRDDIVTEYPEWTPGTTAQPLDGNGIVRLAWSPDGSRLAALGRFGTLHVWRDDRIVTREGVADLAWRSDGMLVEVTTSGDVRLYDTSRDTNHDITRLDGRWAKGLACSPDGTRVAALTGDEYDINGVWCFDMRDDTERRWPMEARGSAASLSWTPDGRYLVTADGGHWFPVRLWEAATGREITD